jgi:ankyrin repeat protein
VYALLLERTPPALALAIACEVGDTERVEALLSADRSLVAALPPEAAGRLPAAAMDEDLAALRRFLGAGWPVNAREGDGATALHWAAWHGDVPLVEDLLARGAPADTREGTFGGTPLGWAVHASVHGWHPARGDYPGVVQILAAAGAPLPDTLAGSPAVRDVLRGLGVET